MENKKLNILFSHYGIKNGEGWGRSFLLARELAGLGNKVTFLTSQYGEFIFPFRKEIIDGVEVISFPDIVPRAFRKGGLGFLNIILKTIYVLFQKYDIVHSDSGHRPSSGIPCVVHRFFHKSKYVSEWWDYFGKGGIYDEMPWWYKLTLGNYDTWAEVHNKRIADGVVALSNFTRERAIKSGITENKISIIHGGADIVNIRYYPDTSYKSKLGIPDDSLTFALIGMNEEELQELHPFIEAFNELKDLININWFSIGCKLSAHTKHKYNLGEEYIDYNWITYSQQSIILSAAEVFLLLRRDIAINKAGWPNKLGDYLAAGRPILTNGIGDVKEYVVKFNKAFIEVEYDKIEIKKAILYLYKNKCDVLKSGKYSREIAETQLSWKCRADILHNAYMHSL